MKTIRKETERAGFVVNTETGKYELMFSTIIGSPLLTRLRTIEKADARNKYHGREVYDLDTVRIMERETVTTATDWFTCANQGRSTHKEE